MSVKARGRNPRGARGVDVADRRAISNPPHHSRRSPHACFSDDRPQVYKKEASEDAWERCVAFFDKYLKA